MGDLIDYLRDKLAHAQRGCTCPTEDWLATLRPDLLVITDCVEHGTKKRYGASDAWPPRVRWWR